MPRIGSPQYYGAVGPGQIDNRQFTNPGAGTVFFFTLPANEIWQVVTFHYRLATSVAVANRRAYLRNDPISGASQPCNQAVQYVQTLSTTVDGWFLYGSPIVMAATVPFGGSLLGVTGIGEFWCMPGSDLHLNVDAIQAADQISVVEGLFRVFLV